MQKGNGFTVPIRNQTVFKDFLTFIRISCVCEPCFKHVRTQASHKYIITGHSYWFLSYYMQNVDAIYCNICNKSLQIPYDLCDAHFAVRKLIDCIVMEKYSYTQIRTNS